MSGTEHDGAVAGRGRSAGARPSGQPAVTAPPMFVAMSSFVVANGMSDAVRDAFVNRPHLVEAAPGFVRMEVMTPLDCPDELWLLTYWRDEASFQSWHHSPAHHHSHRGIPKGLKLTPRQTQLRYFRQVCT